MQALEKKNRVAPARPGGSAFPFRKQRAQREAGGKARAMAPGVTVPGRIVPRLIVTALAAALLLTGCSTPLTRKRSFMGQASRERQEVAEPVGLNPLGALKTCERKRDPAKGTTRVLVSRPEFFTKEASLMIVALREALAEDKEKLKAPRMELSSRPIRSAREAREEGRRCGALIVLWEQRTSQTLELTLPYPARVPLRALVHRRLCEFGDHSEQANILYLTILGLAALVQDDYELAQFYLNGAKAIDVECLQLPGGGLDSPPGGARQ